MMRDHRVDELAVINQRLASGRPEGTGRQEGEDDIKDNIHAAVRKHDRHCRQHEDAHRRPHGYRHVKHVQVVPEVAPAVDHRKHHDIHHNEAEDHVDPEQQIGTAMGAVAIPRMPAMSRVVARHLIVLSQLSVSKAHRLEDHPDRHADHHEVLGERHEAKRHVAVATDAGAFQLALVDIDSLEH